MDCVPFVGLVFAVECVKDCGAFPREREVLPDVFDLVFAQVAFDQLDGLIRLCLGVVASGNGLGRAGGGSGSGHPSVCPQAKPDLLVGGSSLPQPPLHRFVMVVLLLKKAGLEVRGLLCGRLRAWLARE